MSSTSNASTAPHPATLLALVVTALYAGFRCNEIVGTDAIFLREAPRQAEVILRSLQQGRFWMVGTMMFSALFANVFSFFFALREGSTTLKVLASIALLFASGDVAITTILQIPNTDMLLSGNIPDWETLRSSWILRDRARVGLLLTAATLLFAAVVRRPAQSGA
jgi:hypothetical protein